MTTPNAELAYKVLDHIDAHPEQWDQNQWYQRDDCGTAACFAGWAVVLAGHQISLYPEPREDGSYSYGEIDGSSEESVRTVATRDLGIEGAEVACRYCAGCGTEDAADDALFNGSNSREDLGELVAEIFGPRPGSAS